MTDQKPSFHTCIACVIPLARTACTDGVLKDRGCCDVLSVTRFLSSGCSENTKLSFGLCPSFPGVPSQVHGLDPNPWGILWSGPKVSHKACLPDSELVCAAVVIPFQISLDNSFGIKMPCFPHSFLLSVCAFDLAYTYLTEKAFLYQNKHLFLVS